MASIVGSTEEKIFQIKEWLGLNENPDGDTKLKYGEAAAMRNFRITRDGNLQRRPGSRMIAGMMKNYEIEVQEEEEIVREDLHVCSQLTMYNKVTAEAEAMEDDDGVVGIVYDGFVHTTGDTAVVDYDNYTDYIGWFWRKTDDFIYKLVSCDQTETGYAWTMQRVLSVPSDEPLPIQGLWAGNVGDIECVVCACDGRFWLLNDGTGWTKQYIADLDTENPVFMFGYSKNLYIMNGKGYYVWKGNKLVVNDKEVGYDGIYPVEGYRPLVTVAVKPAGGGTTLEQVNKLNGLRRCWVSPDGTSTTFQLPETNLASVDYVKNLSDGSNWIPGVSTGVTADTTKGTVTFSTAPSAGVSSYEIGWTVKTNYRSQVESMRYAEIFNGTTDNRVFLYGDGSNQAFYSGLDYDGNPRADYFPDLNIVDVGEANTPITSLIRHYSRLLAFKSNSAYSIQYGVTTLADDTTTAAFYTTPVNRAIGNVAPGQVHLVLNSPRTLFGHDVYEWKNNSSYNSNLTNDERQAKRISDRITATLNDFNLSECYCWDDNDGQEYYICYDGKALVHNYAIDAWYYYDNFNVSCMVNYRGQLYYGTTDGKFTEFSYTNRTDFGSVIESYWESGSIAFDRDYMRKYSAMLWVGIKPEEHGEVYVTIQTDKKSVYNQKVATSSLISFSHADFRRWSFNTNRKPHMSRMKIKAKKFVFYKLIFYTEAIDTTVTVLSADMRVRYTGYAR